MTRCAPAFVPMSSAGPNPPRHPGQSKRQSRRPRGEVGFDAGKKINGRKRHILVDTLGLLLGVVVTPASCPERDGAQQVLQRVAGWFTKMRKIWVDGGYTGENFQKWVKDRWPSLKWKSSSALNRPRALRYCLAGGLSSARLAGSCDIDALCEITNARRRALKLGFTWRCFGFNCVDSRDPAIQMLFSDTL